MNTTHRLALGVALTLITASVHAQPLPPAPGYRREGELSPNTQAPSPQAMVAAIQAGSPEKLKATLEYGERVVCPQCVPLLQGKLLGSGSARVREMAAWWLRRQPFAAPVVLKGLKAALQNDPLPERRARAAEALGELMDIHALEVLGTASQADADASVRESAVRGLARLNTPGAGPLITAALADPSPRVRAAALDVVLLVAGFDAFGPLLPLLNDPEDALRAHAARVVGELRLGEAAATLSALLLGDPVPSVRKASAWALGRIGGGAQPVFERAKAAEKDPFVLSAIAVAERMKAPTP